MKTIKSYCSRFALVIFGLAASVTALADPVAAPDVADVTGTITNFTTLVTTVGLAMLTVNIIVRLLSKPKRAG